MKIDSLNKKTIRLILLVTIVFISGAIFLVAHIIAKQAKTQYSAFNDTAIRVLSYSLAPMLNAYDYKQIEDLIIATLSYQTIESIAVFDNNGRLVKSVAKPNNHRQSLDMTEHKITTSLEGIIGTVKIGFAKDHIDNVIRIVTASLGFGLMGGFILLGLCLYGLMRRHIIVPIESLSSTITAMDSRNLSSRVKIHRRDEIGALAGRFNAMVDNLEHSHDALLESEAKYRSMMEALNDAVYICSPDYVIEYMNPAMMERIGRQATGESCFSVIFGLQEKCPWCCFDDIRQGKRMTYDIQNPLDSQYYHVSSAGIVHGDGAISILSVLKDTTELKTLQSHLIQAQKMESIGTLAAGIAHDFNNILSVILGYTEISLQHSAGNHQQVRSLNKIIKASDRAKDLVSQILTFSRRSEDEKSPVQVQGIVREALHFLRSSLPNNISIEEQLGAENDIVLANPTQIHQILMNLCTNASHAMTGQTGTLRILANNVVVGYEFSAQPPGLTPGTYLLLIVKDTGCGMPPEVLEKIFDPYFTTKEIGEGTGLGMAVVHGIIESHKGCIRVKSEPGMGTTFFVYLPVADGVLSEKLAFPSGERIDIATH